MIMKRLKSRSTSVSAAINSFTKNSQPTIIDVVQNKLHYDIANTYAKRVDCSNLAYDIYLKKGYTYASKLPFLIHHWDYLKSTLCIKVTDSSDNSCVGTLSLVKDNDTIGLPMDALYHTELNELRSKGHRLLEATRYVIDPSARNQKGIVASLMQYMFIHAHEIADVTDIVIEVNPSHVKFYENALLYEVIGKEKECGLVNNAPAILMKVSMERYLKAITEEDKNALIFDRKQRRLLFSQFKKGIQKEEMTNLLKTNSPALSKSDSIKLHNLQLMSKQQIVS